MTRKCCSVSLYGLYYLLVDGYYYTLLHLECCVCADMLYKLKQCMHIIHYIIYQGGNQDTAVIITSSIAGGLCIILLGLIIVILTTFIMRRRKLKQRNRGNNIYAIMFANIEVIITQ